MKKIFYTVGGILFTITILILKFFYFDLPSRRLEYEKYKDQLKSISQDSVSILNNDVNVQKLSRNHLVFFDCGSYINCGEKKNFYLNIRQKIPQKIAFYRCNSILGDLFVREEEKTLLGNYIFSYQVYVLSPGKIQLAGVGFNKNSDEWLDYDQNFDLGKYDPCYPWNDLERYWKIYGKASPEQIQSVIDLAKHPQ